MESADEIEALPEFVSHKVVRAAKIVAVAHVEDDNPHYELALEGFSSRTVPESFYARGGPFEEDLGYLVVYEDGYKSWTPSVPFESGYTPAGERDQVAKTLHNSTVSGARKNVKDIKVVGNGDMFQLLCKASSEAEGWMKSTKAMQTPMGCVVQVTTQQRNVDLTYSIAEALTFVPGATIVGDENSGRKLACAAAVPAS